MHANTKKILEDLKRLGVKTEVITSLTSELDSKPAADKFLADGITRTPEFTRLMNQKKQAERELSSAKGGKQTKGAAQSLLDKIEKIEQFLISEDYDEAHVTEMFAEEKAELTAALETETAPNLPASTKTSSGNGNGRVVTLEDVDRTATEKSLLAGMVGFGLAAKANSAFAKYARLHKQYPNETQIDQFTLALQQELDKNSSEFHVNGQFSVEKFADAHFKFSEKEAEINTASEAEKISAAEERGRAAAFRELGQIPTKKPSSRVVHPTLRDRAAQTPSKSPTAETGKEPSAPNPNPNPPQTSAQASTGGVKSEDLFGHLRNEKGLYPFQLRNERPARVANTINTAESLGINLSSEFVPDSILQQLEEGTN